MSLNPYSIIHDIFVGGLQWILETTGVTGIAATALLTALMWLFWGFKVRRYGRVGRSVLGTLTQHALVSGVVVIVALVGLLATGVIPGFNLDAAMAVVDGMVGFFEGLIS
jgi:divalent metal cation (Fe/Co/Zn/Cd) transporter